MRDRSPTGLWEAILGQLELQVTRPNFDTWLRDTTGLRLEGEGQLVVGVPTDFALEWLRSRLAGLVDRTASHHYGTDLSVTFEVLGAQPAPAAPDVNGHSRPAVAALPAPALNPRLTFDTFTVVKSNRMAHRAARHVASGDGRYNPVLIHGQPGLGKTHLLQAIAHAAMTAGRAVLLVTGEEFVDRYVAAVRGGQPGSFRLPYRQCDLLLIDDLQFLGSRSGSQQQFFHIFNTLHSADTQIVATLDQAPRTLAGFSAPLLSRLEAGLTAEVHMPGEDERLAILRAKAAQLPHPLTPNMLELIAHQPCLHIRQLEGALNKIAAFADLSPGAEIDDISRALEPFQSNTPPSTDAVLEAVCHHLETTRTDLASPSRSRQITYARHTAMYLLRYRTQLSLADIGQLFGGRDHTTVLSGCRRIERELRSIPETQSDIQQIDLILNSAAA